MIQDFKKGDKVVMHTCHESTLPEYKGKVWECRTDSYMDKAKQECVFLEGFSGCFLCDFLAIVQYTSEWKSVDNPPDGSVRYLCYIKEINDLGISHYQWNCGYNTTDNTWSDTDGNKVTHWMNLPNPPAQ